MVVFSTVHDQLKNLVEHAFVITEGISRSGELVLSIFSFIEETNKTVPIALKNSVNYLGNFVGIYRSLYLFNCTKTWFNKNKYGERFWEAECWQSTAQLIFITALAILDIPNFLERFQVKHRLLSTTWLGFTPIIVELGSSFFGTWESLHEIFRIQKKANAILQLEGLWSNLQNNDFETFDKVFPNFTSSVKDSTVETPQDRRDKKVIKNEIKLLTKFRTLSGQFTPKVHPSKKWKKLITNMELAKKIAWAIIGIHIASGLMITLKLISYYNSPNIVRFGIPMMELMNAVFGLQFFYLKCAYRKVETLDYDEYTSFA